MDINNFKIELSDIKYGWVSINLYNHNKLLISMSGTGVYNPFYEIPELFKSIKNNKEYIWEVDQEGYDGIITFIPIDNNKIIIKTEELKNDIEFLKTETIFNKSQVLEEIFKSFYIWEKDNHTQMHDYFYEFYFNINKIKAIHKYGKYDEEIITREIYKLNDEIIIEIRDTKEDSIKYKYIKNYNEIILDNLMDSIKLSSIYIYLNRMIYKEHDLNTKYKLKNEAMNILLEDSLFTASNDYIQYILLD